MRATAALAVALVLGAAGAVGAVAPRTTSSLPSLHEVAGWVAAGTRDEVATRSIAAQLSNNEFAWLPKSQCLVTAIDSTNATPCIEGDTTAATTVVLVGDSSADEWALDVGALGTKDRFRVVVYVHAACPVGDIVVETKGEGPDPSCATFRSLVLPDLASMDPAPALVIVSELRLSNYLSASGGAISNAAWAAALTTTLTTIEKDGVGVAELHGVPVATVDPAQCLAANPSHMTRCSVRARAADVGGYDHATWEGAKAAGAVGVDVSPLFCTATSCPAVAHGDVTHSGVNHVTETYASAVRPALGQLLGLRGGPDLHPPRERARVLDAILGGAPSAAVLRACRALPV